jgi:hypothetical protein
MTFSADGRTATLQMANAAIIDQPRWPAMDAETTPAFMDFKLVFQAGTEPVKYEDPARQYRFEGFKATAQLEATFRVPSIDFTFRTDPLESSSSDFAVMGEEVNGRYYDAVRF